MQGRWKKLSVRVWIQLKTSLSLGKFFSPLNFLPLNPTNPWASLLAEGGIIMPTTMLTIETRRITSRPIWACKSKKKCRWFKVHYAPCFVIPHGLSTLYRCSLTTVAQDKPLIRDFFNHKGSCTLFRPHLTFTARISSLSFVRVSTRQLAVSFLSEGISSTLNFHENTGTDGTQSRNLSHPKWALYRLS